MDRCKKWPFIGNYILFYPKAYDIFEFPLMCTFSHFPNKLLPSLCSLLFSLSFLLLLINFFFLASFLWTSLSSSYLSISVILPSPLSLNITFLLYSFSPSLSFLSFINVVYLFLSSEYPIDFLIQQIFPTFTFPSLLHTPPSSPHSSSPLSFPILTFISSLLSPFLFPHNLSSSSLFSSLILMSLSVHAFSLFYS